jgi:hypothetical protein
MQPLVVNHCASSGLEQQKEIRKMCGYEATDTLKELGEIWVIDRNLLIKLLSEFTCISGN